MDFDPREICQDFFSKPRQLGVDFDLRERFVRFFFFIYFFFFLKSSCPNTRSRQL